MIGLPRGDEIVTILSRFNAILERDGRTDG